MRRARTAMGVSDVWRVDMPRMLGQTSLLGRALEFCPFDDNGQVERPRIGENEGLISLLFE